MERFPALNARVLLRNPGERPAREYDALNRPTGPAPEWGVETWAHREDGAPMEDILEDGVVLERRTVFTIRERDGIAADVQVIHEGRAYASIGPAVRRGGPGSGRAARYLELHCRLRT